MSYPPSIEETFPLLSSPDLGRYIRRLAGPAGPAYEAAAEAALALGGLAKMRIPPEEAVLLTLLTRLTRPRIAVEIGTFTGCSAAAIALGLPPEGLLLTCDPSAPVQRLARQALAPFALVRQVDFVSASALELLERWDPERQIDFAFVDGEKSEYFAYHAALVPLLAPGALLVVDNACLRGRVSRSTDMRDDVVKMRHYNDFAADDPRLEGVVLPLADGIHVMRRRS